MKLRNLFLTLLVASSHTAVIFANDEADKSNVYSFKILSSSAYTDEHGRQMLDVIEGAQSYLALYVVNHAGQPVTDVKPKFTISGTSVLMGASDAAPLKTTDESGIMEFGIVAGVKGLDQLAVSYGVNSAELHINIISLNIHTFDALSETESSLKWRELMEARIEYQDDTVVASFPSTIMQQAGERVNVVGYMLPLDADTKQRHFLLTSAPPSCFYHIPGGPAGVIEVFSEDGIEASWASIQLSGTLVLIDKNSTGIVYQLEDAMVRK